MPVQSNFVLLLEHQGLEMTMPVLADPHMLAPAAGAAGATAAAEGAPAGPMGPGRAHMRAHAAADALHRQHRTKSQEEINKIAPGRLECCNFQ